MTDGRAVEIFVIADNGAMEMSIAVAVKAHMKRQCFLKGGWINPFFKERCWKLFDHPRFDAGPLAARRRLAL